MGAADPQGPPRTEASHDLGWVYEPGLHRRLERSWAFALKLPDQEPQMVVRAARG